MVTGYLLIKLVPGLEEEALRQIKATEGIEEVNLVFGSWDALARYRGGQFARPSAHRGEPGAGNTGSAGHVDPGAGRDVIRSDLMG